MCSTDIFLGLLAFLFPPLAVWVKCGICSADSIINILLCMLGYLPGLIHAWYIIAKYPEPTYEYEGPTDAEGGHIYVFVRDGRGGHRVQHQQPKPLANNPGGNMNYGTATTAGAAPSSSAPHRQSPKPQQPNQVPQQYEQEHGVADGGGAAAAGPSDGRQQQPPPPSYAQVVAGDHKVQTQE